MYKWPQGRVIRTICLILTLLVVADLLGDGAYGPLTFYFGGQEGANKQLVVGILYAVLAIMALITGFVAAGFHHKAVDFLIEVEQEMVKVEWPKGNVLVRSTVIIAIAIAVMAVLILGVDSANFYVLALIQSLGSKI